MNVSWVEGDLDGYQTSVELSAKDRDGLTLDVAMALSALKVRVNGLFAKAQPDGYAGVTVEITVKDLKELTGIINKLSQIQGVFLVQRANG